MQITISPHFFGLILIAIPLPFEIITFVARRSEVKRKQIFLLTLCYVCLNIVWYLTIMAPKNSLVLNLILYIISIVSICYSYFYWMSQVEIKARKRRIQILIINLLLIFYAVSFAENLGFKPKSIFYFVILIYSQMVAIYFAGTVVVNIVKNHSSNKRVTTIAVLLASSVACVFPTALFFSEDFLFKYLAVNIGFLILTIAYIREYLIQMKIEFIERIEHISLQHEYERQSKELEIFKREASEMLEESKKNNEVVNQKYNLESRIDEVLARYPDLTERQLQVAKLIVMEIPYPLISERLFISENTVRTHAMDICQKLNIKGYKRLRHFILNEAKNIN